MALSSLKTGRHAQTKMSPGLASRSFVVGSVAVVAALAVSALVNRQRARTAERANQPAGTFMEVDGLRLHYVERGDGEPLVLLHGNGSMIQDFETSGIVGLAATRYRVIVFDRPGFGHSDRPRGTIWTANAQADLLERALRQIGVERAVVLGHSWGASVAVALATRHPAMVKALVLASGYYFPTARADVVGLSIPAVPILGDILRYTLSPLLGRLMWPMIMRKIFGPAPVPPKFRAFPSAMALRPSQIRASAAESGLMIPDAVAAQGSYEALKMPVAIIAGESDRLINIWDQSAALHHLIPHSTFHPIKEAGHMVHQTAPMRVLAAIDDAARASAGRCSDAAGTKVEAAQ